MNALWGTLWRLLGDPRVSTVLVLALSVIGGSSPSSGYWGTADLALVVYRFRTYSAADARGSPS